MLRQEILYNCQVKNVDQADGTNNAVFVKSLDEVTGVLDAFLNAAAAGELDTAITKVAERQPRIKPGAAKAAANANA